MPASSEETTIDTIKTISSHLQTGLDSKSLDAIVTLISNGVHPDAISALILELRRETQQHTH